MTTQTMNDIADSLDEASENLETSLLEQGNELQEFASKTVYSTFYYFSYGVCFVGFLAGKVIPKTGVVGQGLRDGSQAARDAVERITSQTHDDGEFGDPIPLDDADDEPAPVAPSRKRSTAAKSPAKRTRKSV